MKLSLPIYRLKHQAKKLSRTEGIPLHQALDIIATKQGFARWSLLSAAVSAAASVRKLLARIDHGDLLLIGARPGQGKTQLSLELAVEAMKAGHRGVFFTLEYNAKDMLSLFKSIGQDPAYFSDTFEFDASDAINAEYIMGRLSVAPKGTIAVIDYLQLLDQKRENPMLMTQVHSLKLFARERGIIMVFISQIDRACDSLKKSHPGFDDVRLPNPLDLSLFDKGCFLNKGELQLSLAG